MLGLLEGGRGGSVFNVLRIPLFKDSHWAERAEPNTSELPVVSEAVWEHKHYLYTLDLAAVDELRGKETRVPHQGHCSLTQGARQLYSVQSCLTKTNNKQTNHI